MPSFLRRGVDRSLVKMKAQVDDTDQGLRVIDDNDYPVWKTFKNKRRIWRLVMLISTPLFFASRGPFSIGLLRMPGYPILMLFSYTKFSQYGVKMKRIEDRSPVVELDSAIDQQSVSKYMIEYKKK